MTNKTDTEQERAELLPCPFCGGEAFMEEHPPHKHSDWLVKMGMPEYSAGSFTIECVACECGMIHESRDGVVAAWNRRAALQSQDDPLQPAANWLFKAIAECKVADIRWALRIGHNRAQRLFDHARRVEGGSHEPI